MVPAGPPATRPRRVTVATDSATAATQSVSECSGSCYRPRREIASRIGAIDTLSVPLSAAKVLRTANRLTATRSRQQGRVARSQDFDWRGVITLEQRSEFLRLRFVFGSTRSRLMTRAALRTMSPPVNEQREVKARALSAADEVFTWRSLALLRAHGSIPITLLIALAA